MGGYATRAALFGPLFWESSIVRKAPSLKPNTQASRVNELFPISFSLPQTLALAVSSGEWAVGRAVAGEYALALLECWV